MTLRLAVVIGLGLCVALFGCGGGAPQVGPPKPARVTRTAAKPMAEASPVALADTESKSAADVGEAPSARAKAEGDAQEPSGIPPLAPPFEGGGERGGVERLAILTPGGPLLIDVKFTIDGRPYSVDFDARLKTVLDAADTSGDGQPTWAEFIANKSYLESVGAGEPNVNPRQRKMWVEQYDLNEDGRLQSEEAAAWLGRDSGRAARAFALRSNRSYLPDPRATSRIWRLLDGDNDGALATAEIQGAADVLFSLDADDDQIVAATELASLRDELSAADGQMAPAANRNSSHYAAIHLEPKADIARLEYLLNDMYAPRQDLSAGSFPEYTRLADQLDANSDNWLERDELAEMLNAPAYAELTVAFAPAAPGKSGVTVQVDRHAPELSVATSGSADRLVIQSGGTRLIVAAQDLPAPPAGPQPGMQPADRTQLRAMVHDRCDALFEELDADADGRLGTREIASSPARLLELDADHDGQLSADEFPRYMVVAFLRGESPGEQSFYVPARTASAPAEVKAAAWFRHADYNGDGYLSRREFLGSGEQFGKLDGSRDGFIDAREAAAVDPVTAE